MCSLILKSLICRGLPVVVSHSYVATRCILFFFAEQYRVLYIMLTLRFKRVDLYCWYDGWSVFLMSSHFAIGNTKVFWILWFVIGLLFSFNELSSYPKSFPWRSLELFWILFRSIYILCNSFFMILDFHGKLFGLTLGLIVGEEQYAARSTVIFSSKVR